MLALLFSCHAKTDFADPLSISASFGCFHLQLSPTALQKLDANIFYAQDAYVTGVPSWRSELFLLTVQQLHADNVPVAYLLAWLLPFLMPPFLHKCSMAFVSLTLACFLQVEKQNFITEELIHREHLFR